MRWVRDRKAGEGLEEEGRDGGPSTCGLHTHTTLILCSVDEKWCLCATLTEE